MTTSSQAGDGRPLVICYDGTAEAAEALRYAASLLPGARALIVTVAEPIVEEALTPAAKPPVADLVEVQEMPRRAAEEVAAEGERRAAAAGLRPEPRAIEARGATWQAVEAVATEHDALLVVCGTRRSGIRSALPGSLARALVSHLSRPVLVVPSGKTAAERRHDAEARILGQSGRSVA
jgi:nucleotide-binding universal stress UspA family protein